MIPKMFYLIMMRTSINGGRRWNGFLGGGSKFVVFDFVIEHRTADITVYYLPYTVA